jgi:LmbE family N-acetylglucosaminyl deacetylase
VKILLAPHADDETLFACATLLREHPTVILCLPGATRHGGREVRLAEFTAAMVIVGCPWISLIDTDLEPALARLNPEHVWAPLPELDGNTDHNMVGELAARLWPGKVTFYTTYTKTARTTRGSRVDCEPSWPAIKRRALACYRSQQEHPGTREHFVRPLDEYVVQWEDADSDGAFAQSRTGVHE